MKRENWQEENGVSNLLTLIGDAVEKLQRSIGLFTQAKQEAGLKELQEVTAGIDRYVQKIDEDPLLSLASLDRELIIQELQGVKQELAVVIEELTTTSTD